MESVFRFLRRAMYVVMMITSICSYDVFAKSGLEVVGFGTFGLGKGRQNSSLFLNKGIKEISDGTTLKGSTGIEGTLIAQVGYMFQVNDIQAISVLGELGYSRDVFAFQHIKTDPAYKFRFSSDSFLTGAVVKYNLDFVSFGVAGGIKVPASGTFASQTLDKNNNIVDTVEVLNYPQIQEWLGFSIIPYVRLSMDFSIFFSDNLSMIVGVYSGMDFGPNIISYPGVFDYNKTLEYNILNSFDFGVTLGVKFGHEIVKKDRTPPPRPEPTTTTTNSSTTTIERT